MNKWRRFAPLGLYLSGLALLVSAGLYIVQREFNLYLQISLALVVAGLALCVLLDPDRARQALTGRQARYGSNALVLTIAFTGILVVINLLIYQNPRRWDLTEDRLFTLAPESIQTLKRLEQPVQAQAFFSSGLNPQFAQSLLDQYKYHSDGKFDYRFIDPYADPVAAEQAKITRDGTIVLRMGDQQQQAASVTEQEITGAMVRLMNPNSRVLYFLTGHGEFSPEASGQRGYTMVKRVLESKNYTVNSLNLLADKVIPEDADMIVVAGPQQPVSGEEAATLKAFVEQGGSLVVLEDPILLTDFGEAEDPLAEYFSTDWGIDLGRDLIVDVTSQQASVVAIGTEYGSHPITQQLSGLATILPGARSVSASRAVDGVSQVVLVSTSPQSWAETDFEALQSENPEVKPDEGQEIFGPVPVVVGGEHFQNEGRVVVFGDADLASDEYFTAYANGDLFVNAVDWAAGEEELISLTPKANTQRFVVPPSTIMLNLILLGSVFILPGAVLVAGVVVWIQRRKRG